MQSRFNLLVRRRFLPVTGLKARPVVLKVILLAPHKGRVENRWPTVLLIPRRIYFFVFSPFFRRNSFYRGYSKCSGKLGLIRYAKHLATRRNDANGCGVKRWTTQNPGAGIRLP